MNLGVAWDGSVDPMCLGFQEGNGRGRGGFCRAVVSTGRRGRTVKRITGAREARAQGTHETSPRRTSEACA